MLGAARAPTKSSARVHPRRALRHALGVSPVRFIDVIPSLNLVVVRFGKDPAGKLDLAAIAKDQRFEKHDQILSAVLGAMK